MGRQLSRLARTSDWGPVANVDWMVGCESLTKVTIDSCPNIINLEGFKNLSALTVVTVKDCNNLTNIDGLSERTALTMLGLRVATIFRTSMDSRLAGAWVVWVYNCDSLTYLEGFIDLAGHLRMLR